MNFFSSISTSEITDTFPKASPACKEDHEKMLHDIDITQDMINQKLKMLKINHPELMVLTMDFEFFCKSY